MADQRHTNPAGCVHRFPASPGGFECRAHPMKPLLGGARDAPAVIYRFPACVHRCGEYDIGPPPVIVITSDIDPHQVEEFRRAWDAARPSSVVVGNIATTYQRDPAAAWSIPAADEGERR